MRSESFEPHIRHPSFSDLFLRDELPKGSFEIQRGGLKTTRPQAVIICERALKALAGSVSMALGLSLEATDGEAYLVIFKHWPEREANNLTHIRRLEGNIFMVVCLTTAL